MKLYYKKEFLLEIGENEAGFLIRKIQKKKGRVKYDDSSVTLQNPTALAVAKEEFWELN